MAALSAFGHGLFSPPSGFIPAAASARLQEPKSFVARFKRAGPAVVGRIVFHESGSRAILRRRSSATMAPLSARHHGLLPRHVGLNKRIRLGSRPMRRSASSQEPK